MTRIEQFGWKSAPEPGIGRIVSAHGDYYHLVCDEQPTGEILARKKKSVFKFNKLQDRNQKPEVRNESNLNPITGDFVRFRYNPHGESLITGVLPRFSHFERKDPASRRKSQTLAVNFDTLFVMMSLNENFSVARIERFLALAEDIGEAEAVVVITKVDLRESGDEAYLRELRDAIGDRARMLEVSSVSGEGLEGVRGYMQSGKTIAFIGSSGVGKSTLLNTLVGEEWQATQEIQDWSGKGRHTTTSRELIMTPSGAMIIDTPGIREIGALGEADQIMVKGECSHRYRK